MSGKNQKFDRNRKRSPSMARYRAEDRAKINKIKKMRKHVKAHPNDQRNDSLLKAGGGTIIQFPTHKVEDNRGKVHTHEVTDDLRKAAVTYEVKSAGTTISVSAHYSEVFKVYNESRSECILYEMKNGQKTILKNKKAVIPKGFEGDMRKLLKSA